MGETSSPTDSDLIRAIQTGDLAAFDALYARHEEWVVSLALRFSGNREDALDVLQETFSYVLRKLPKLELTSRFTTFLYPVVKHLSLDRIQAARRTASIPGGGTPDPGRVDSGSAEELLADLSDLHREILELRFVDGLELKEIASALTVPLGTVKSRLHAAIQSLRARNL